jgi:hypothetical protein
MPRAALSTTLLLGSLAAASALGEAAVRVLAPQQLVIKRPDIWRGVDTLGWAHRPNLRTTINTGERLVHVVTDSEGFRVGRAGGSAGRFHVLLLGDSFMEAFQVEYEQSLAGLLEARLPRRLGETVTVVNTGVGGWDPPQYFLQARSLLARRAFDLVLIALYVGNDVVQRRVTFYPARAPAEVHRLRLPRRLRWSEVVAALLYPINDFLVVRSHLFVFLKNRLHTTLTRLHLASVYFPDVLLRREAASSRWAVTADICRDIAALADRVGSPTLVVLVPTSYQVSSAAFGAFLREFRIAPDSVDLDQPSRLMRAALERRHLKVLDALPVFRAADRAARPLYGSVDSHLSPAGHDVLERFLEPAVGAALRRRRPALSGGRGAGAAPFPAGTAGDRASATPRSGPDSGQK